MESETGKCWVLQGRLWLVENSDAFIAVFRTMTGSVPAVSLNQASIDLGRRAGPRSCNLRRSLLQVRDLQLRERITQKCTAQEAELTQNSELVVGIDLGTTNSAVAVSHETRLSCEPSSVSHFSAPLSFCRDLQVGNP